MHTHITPKVAAARLFPMIATGNLTALTRQMDLLIAHYGDEMLLALNQFLAIPTHLSLLLRHTLAKPALLHKVQHASYYHENGFHKIVLLSGTHFKLRLHHFGSTVKLPMENVHDHRWAFASSILSGSLHMDLFEVNHEAGEPVIHYCYHSDKSSGQYTTTVLGEKYVRVTKSCCYTAGDQYFMDPKDLHRITNKPGEESITLILTGSPVGTTCNLYARRQMLEEEKKPVSYTTEDLQSMLRQLDEKINPVNN